MGEVPEGRRGTGSVEAPVHLRISQGSIDCREHVIGMLQYVDIPEAKHAIVLPRQKVRALLIVVTAFEVLAAVEFDDQSGLRADEIADIAADGNLPPEAEAADPAASQTIPQQALCLGRRLHILATGDTKASDALAYQDVGVTSTDPSPSALRAPPPYDGGDS